MKFLELLVAEPVGPSLMSNMKVLVHNHLLHLGLEVSDLLVNRRLLLLFG